MRKIKRPRGLIGVNGKMAIAIDDIIPFVPGKSGFVDTRHWVWGGVDEAFPFAVTTRINANMQQYYIEFSDD